MNNDTKSSPRLPETKAPSVFAQELSALFPGRHILTVKEVSQAMGVSAQHVHDLILEGKLPAFDIAGENPTGRTFWRVPARELVAYVDSRRNL